MNRYDKTMLATAKLFGELSYCEKKKVGAVIAKDGRILATGYNGTVSGFDNTCETLVENSCKECQGTGGTDFDINGNILEYCGNCNGTGNIPRLVTSPYVIHAEQNALMFCTKNGIPTDGTTMYITLSPCVTCAKLIVQAGIKRVVFLECYKELGGLEFLRDAGVELLYWEVKEQEGFTLEKIK